MANSERIQYIIRALNHSGGVTLNDVAEAFGVTTRQAARDIEYLRDRLSAPIAYDHKERRYVLTGFWENYTDIDERIVIMGAYLKAVSRKVRLGAYFSDQIEESLNKGIPSKVRRVLDRVVYRSPVMEVPDWKVLSSVIDALSSRVCLRFLYEPLKGGAAVRLCEPQSLVNYGNSWYLIGWDRDRGATRTYHLSRIKDPEIVAEAASHDLQVDSDSYGIFFEGTPVDYVIRFTGAAAKIVSTQEWSPGQKAETFPDGSLVLTLPASTERELLPAVLGFADEAQPLAPASFVEAHRKAVERMANRFIKRP